MSQRLRTRPNWQIVSIVAFILLLVWFMESLWFSLVRSADSESTSAHVIPSVPSTGRLIESVAKPPFASERCVLFDSAPGKTPLNDRGEFAFITSFAWINSESSFYIVALGKNFFTRGGKNIAVNVSFPYDVLQHPVRLFIGARRGSRRLRCEKMTTGTKDISLHEKIHVTRCSCEDSCNGDDRFVTMHIGRGERCVRFPTNGPSGVLARTIRTLKPLSSPDPTTALCIAGVQTFTRYAKELITFQVRNVGIDRVFLGLNTEDENVMAMYEAALADLVTDGRVIVVEPAVSSADVVFSQGKLPMFNECLLVSKSLGIDFLATWDMDELLVPSRSLSVSKSMASSLAEMSSGENLCYYQTSSASRLRNPGDSSGSGVLSDDFPLEAVQDCGNYSKAIAVVKNVQVLGVHSPEACTLFPRDRRFSSRTDSFVHHLTGYRLLHLVQLWQSQRYEGRCKAVSKPFLPTTDPE